MTEIMDTHTTREGGTHHSKWDGYGTIIKVLRKTEEHWHILQC